MLSETFWKISGERLQSLYSMLLTANLKCVALLSGADDLYLNCCVTDPAIGMLSHMVVCYRSFLPLHAAGIYNEPPGTSLCVSDFAVSSYIPNVTTLIDMVKDNSKSQAQSSNSFLK